MSKGKEKKKEKKHSDKEPKHDAIKEKMAHGMKGKKK